MLRQEVFAAAAKSLQLCLTLCDLIDSSPPGSPIPGILQARTLEWVAISFSNAWKWKVKVKSLSRVRLLATPWTAAHQAPPSMGFSRQEYWSGVPLPSPVSEPLVLGYLSFESSQTYGGSYGIIPFLQGAAWEEINMHAPFTNIPSSLWLSLQFSLLLPGQRPCSYITTDLLWLEWALSLLSS